MAAKPNLAEIDAQSSFAKRLSARFRINSMANRIYGIKASMKGDDMVELGKDMTKTHNWLLYFSAAILGLGVYSSVLTTMIRKDTFKRNFALIEKKYGQSHRDAFGEDTAINKLGYPDMGNNLYADLLPYKDWIKMNNAQRMHEAGYEYTLVFLPNAFITALSFPKTAMWLTGIYAVCRFNLINSYTGFRGYNAAVLHEELMRLDLIIILATAFASGTKIMGGENFFGAAPFLSHGYGRFKEIMKRSTKLRWFIYLCLSPMVAQNLGLTEKLPKFS